MGWNAQSGWTERTAPSPNAGRRPVCMTWWWKAVVYLLPVSYSTIPSSTTIWIIAIKQTFKKQTDIAVQKRWIQILVSHHSRFQRGMTLSCWIHTPEVHLVWYHATFQYKLFASPLSQTQLINPSNGTRLGCNHLVHLLEYECSRATVPTCPIHHLRWAKTLSIRPRRGRLWLWIPLWISLSYLSLWISLSCLSHLHPL